MDEPKADFRVALRSEECTCRHWNWLNRTCERDEQNVLLVMRQENKLLCKLPATMRHKTFSNIFPPKKNLWSAVFNGP